MEYKVCSKCRKELPISFFRKAKKYKDGLRCECDVCKRHLYDKYIRHYKCAGCGLSLSSTNTRGMCDDCVEIYDNAMVIPKIIAKEKRFYGKTECVEMAFDPLLLSLQPPIKRECDEQDTSKQDYVSIEVCNLTQDELDFLLTPLK